jgi:transcriptional antiterminator NusG
VVEVRSGKSYKSQRRFFPGYMLLQINMNDQAWHLVRRLPNVIGFVGGTKGGKPAPITDAEAMSIIKQLKTKVDQPKPKVLFEVGEVVRVTDGPLEDFSATVEVVNYEKNKLKVSVVLFEISTPVELLFSQVEKTT